MATLDKYILKLCSLSFFFFTMVFSLIIWINVSLSLLDRLAPTGNELAAIAPLMFLTIPDVFVRVFPVSTFASVVFVISRIRNESEFTVMSASGIGPLRMVRPYVLFGVLTSVLTLINTIYFAPLSNKKLDTRKSELSQNLSSKLLQSGKFLHPIQGITVFIGDVSPTGELTDILISDRRTVSVVNEYTAVKAYVSKDEQEVVLIMQDGLLQSYESENRLLSLTQFDELSFDISTFVNNRQNSIIKVKHLPTWLLWTSPSAAEQTTGKSLAVIQAHLHSRLYNGLLPLIATLIGFITLYAGAHSRYGNARHVIQAIFYLVIVKLVESNIVSQVRLSEGNWPLVYAPLLVGLTIYFSMLLFAEKRQKFFKFFAQNMS